MTLTFAKHSSSLCVHFTQFMQPIIRLNHNTNKTLTAVLQDLDHIFNTYDVLGTISTHSIFETPADNPY